MTPSNKKIPECRININPSQDFFLERMMKVDTEGWEPVLTLMHQFAEMFNFYDYVTLGAKIAKYVENVSTYWFLIKKNILLLNLFYLQRGFNDHS